MTDRTNSFLLGVAAAVAAAGAIGLIVALRPKEAHSSDHPHTKPPPSPPPDPALAPALATLVAEIDSAWPKRNRASDGGAPSAAHHAKNPHSDHERRDAYDVTADYLNGPDPGALAELARRDSRVSYVIWNHRISNKSIQNGAWRPYELTTIQTDPHTSHVHISVRHDARDDAGKWGADALRQEKIA